MSDLERRLKEHGAAACLVVSRTAAWPDPLERRVRAAAAALEPSRRRTALAAMALEGELPDPVVSFPRLGAAFAVLDATTVGALRADAAVSEVHLLEPLEPVWARATSPAASPGDEWGLDLLRVKEAWARGFRGAGVVVGHVDTGVDDRHPSLHGTATSFARFYAGGGGGPFPLPSFDTQWHGSHTAGTIAGRAHGGRNVGVAPDAHLAAAIYDWAHAAPQLSLLRCLDWVLGTGARVLSLSVGLQGCSVSLKTVFGRLRAKGVLPVVCVGNDGAGFARWPGSYTESLCVGATTAPPPALGAVWTSSGSGGTCPASPSSVPELVAPGSPVSSARAGGSGFLWLEGTSCAVPHVAGLAAILWSAKPSATVAEVEAAILASCRPISGVPAERQGAGVPDAVAALTILTGVAPPSA